MEASTSDRQADGDVHILCIDDVAARAIDMAAVEKEEGQQIIGWQI